MAVGGNKMGFYPLGPLITCQRECCWQLILGIHFASQSNKRYS